MSFEGSEKALEVVIADGAAPLRALSDAYLRSLVAVADGTVLRRTVTAHVDTYLLAESTLFVTDRHLLMLTCGRTRLYRAAEQLVRDLGVGSIAALSLTRLGERFPEEQTSTVEQDAERLAAALGGAFVPIGVHGPHRGGAFVYEAAPRALVPGETRMRVVGNDIDGDVAACFSGDVRTHQQTALARVLAHLGADLHDAFDFAPSGYSLNSVGGARTWALHVTPEHASSYVSLVSSSEDEDANARLVHDTLETFAPRTCLVTSQAPITLPGRYVRRHTSTATIAGRVVHVVEGERA